MKQHKRFALILALLLPLANMVQAEARPGSTSFSRGFSAQKSNIARSAKAPAPQPSFGSFGRNTAPAPAAAPQRSESALNRDLQQRAAQDTALRNYDARRSAAGAGVVGGAAVAGGAAANNTPPLPPLNPVAPGGRGEYGQVGSDSYARQALPAPVIIHERSNSNGWLWGLGGYMLGRSAGAHNHQPQMDATPAGAGSTAAGGTAPNVPAAPATSSSGWSVLGWLLVMGIGVWLVLRIVRQRRSSQQTNYTFERN
jgi:hypothetical protein